ncbi:presqualene diphosphate synthase HpnD [Candidatus Nitrotoga sp. M5]|uniref:presqualene diphosphate synthase HpnD n=1 Tax=Candidatus Nitrotoga sp. M5 TaxID=2890409 RepID=UPI001EF30234|nr:presqualene diphosphate synthase HpnD [Candidatus Nitrotoga sp. M5]CAH1385122.1 Phytoene synthase [Candidatus Nitrotoga sp. M5]
MTPDQYCKDKAAQSGSSFYYSFMFLPSDKRRAITALYAFCREVDDVVDENSDENVAHSTLAWWHTEVTAIYTGTPQHPVTRALKPVVKQYNLPQEYFHEIIDGMEMDLQQHQYVDFKALEQYCYRVASVVGLLTVEIFGYTDRNTLKYAHDLGLAFQLTNIIRDVGEDARRGRIYLPLNELALFGVHVNDILDNKEGEGFQKLMQFQVDRAQRYYQRALEQLPDTDRKAQRTGLIMAAIYRTTLEEIVASGCHVLKERVSLTPLRKLWLACKTWVKN